MRWTLEDRRSRKGAGYLSIQFDGKDTHIDVFPHCRGVDEQEVLRRATRIVAALNQFDVTE